MNQRDTNVSNLLAEYKSNLNTSELQPQKLIVLKKIQAATARALRNNKPLPVFDNLITIVADEAVLKVAYTRIKSNKGANTAGTDEEKSTKTI